MDQWQLHSTPHVLMPIALFFIESGDLVKRIGDSSALRPCDYAVSYRISRPTGHEIPPDCLSLLAASNLAAGMFLGFNQSVGPSVDCPAQAEAEPPPQALRSVFCINIRTVLTTLSSFLAS